MDEALQKAVGDALGTGVKDIRRVSGGDINEAYRATLADGRTVFVKTNARSPRGMFQAEAVGLTWLADASAIRVPRVLAVSGPDARGSAFLALEWIESGPRVRDFDERLGRQLAELHRAAPGGFGLDHANFIGRLPQDNTPAATWSEFFHSRRLKVQLRMAVDAGRASRAMRDGFARLFARLADLVGPTEPPARLHGDLWGGNLHVDERGEPCLIDPAVYGGHREMDLAMMKLFGGFGPRVFRAYEEAWPLAPGADDRVRLYQLYPLMVHVNLFGGSYAGSVEATLTALV